MATHNEFNWNIELQKITNKFPIISNEQMEYLFKEKKRIEEEKIADIEFAKREALSSLEELRNKFIEEIFSEIENKLLEHVETKEYIKELENNLLKGYKKYKEGIFYVNEKDYKKLENSQIAIPKEQIRISDSYILGGFMLIVDNKTYNNTFIRLLKQYKRDFQGLQIHI